MVCANCGLTELYAKDFVKAFELGAKLPWGADVRIVESPTAGPFR